ncbi:hypothetical protein D3871_11955 [Noviherbaspirillum saxi]|uniref:NHL repeat-containing protein n=2 Tax=Noviherbaspirillum saxi TaxID=2320863 RepID=A0A3A3FSF7_9BURK|nr:hypothetical protein D3871_11955 [Noviherbaspirillum saxi]
MSMLGAVSTFAGKEGVYGYADGIGQNVKFPAKGSAIASDMDGNAYVTDPEQFTVRKITPTGSVSTIAGIAGVQGTNNGYGTEAKFWSPKGIASNRSGDVYVSDLIYQNDGSTPAVNDGSNLPITTIRNITRSGSVSTLVDVMGMTWEDSTFKVVNPTVFTTDKAGNLYIAEVGWRRIKKIAPDGTVSSAGGLTEEWPGYGRGVVSYLRGMAADGKGNVFLLFEGHGLLSHGGFTSTRIEKVTAGNYATLFAGRATVPNGTALQEEPSLVDGKGSDARFSSSAKGITIDDVGNLYVADTGNHSIRKITPDGTVSTLIGSKKGVRLGSSPSLDSPTGITFAAPNTLLITTPGSVLKFQ